MEKWYLTDEDFLSGLKKSYFNKASLLFLIRSGIAKDWNTLCKSLGMSIEPWTNSHVALRHFLSDLKELEFIQFNDERNEYDEPLSIVRGKISYTGKWDKIQQKLGLSLAELSSIDYESIVVSPIFYLPKKLDEPIDIFVLMPFDEKFKPVYDDHIRNVANKLNLVVKRADDFFSSSKIIDDVWNAIFSAKIIIADCTDRNPNVFYEIGIAHTLGKKVILITQDSKDVPFDINHIRYIEYDFTPRGMDSFEKVLSKAIQKKK